MKNIAVCARAEVTTRMQMIMSMYLTLFSVILAGISNMVWCKLPVMKWANLPMDRELVLADGKRLFGKNKTWKGFFGMIFFNIIWQVLIGLLLNFTPPLEALNLIYLHETNNLSTNFVVGFWLGLAYVAFELPNSWLKRRLDIAPGKTASNPLKWIFIIIDQIDSLLGCALVIAWFVPISLPLYLAFVALGGLTHLVINQGLYVLKLRRNQF